MQEAFETNKQKRESGNFNKGNGYIEEHPRYCKLMFRVIDSGTIKI